MMLASSTGAIEVFNSGSRSFSVSDSKVSWSTGSASFKRIDRQGNRIYETGTNEFGQKSQYIFTPDFKNLAIVVFWDGWAMTNWLTDNATARNNFYKKNKNIRSNGVDFISLYESTQSSSNSSSSGRSKNCSTCNNTRVEPTKNSGGSLTSWVAYYNPRGTKCRYCNSSTEHFHDRCSHCNVPSR